MVFCACGCGEEIPWAKHHSWKPARFIIGHQSRGISRTIAPPPDWVPPSGLCECGCGRETPIARQTHVARGLYAGFPIRFIHGHQTRGKCREHSPRWKGGRKQNRKGYWYVFLPEHHLANSAGYVPEHRLIWETAHGVELKRSDFIHHIDGNPANNALDNLQRMTQKEHADLHRDSVNGRMASVK